MIAVDTSIIAAIAFNEPERELFISRILASERALINAATLVEVRIVIRSRSNERGAYFVEEFLKLPSFEIVAVDGSTADIASQAYVAFGKGSGHPDQLNFGDVFSYALAKAKSHTDVQVCSWQ